MHLSILGPLAVESDGRPADVGGAVRRRLLAILALGRNRAIPAERLIDLVWGDDPPATATNTLQVHVAALRRALAADGGMPGTARIRTDPGGYRLVTEPDEVDAETFERAVADAQTWAGLDRRRAIRQLEAALELWRGDVLADVALPADLLPEVARLEALRAAAIDLRLRLRIAAGDGRGALPELERLGTDDPTNETWVALRMVLLYRAGRQADALAAYQATRRRLADELGLEPSPELRRLELAILRQDPDLDADAALGLAPALAADVGAPDRLPAELTSFVGRDAELREIDAVLDGRARLVTIVGIGGAGKSRLALRAARARRSRYAHGAAWAELVAASSAEHVAEAIATAVGLRQDLEPPLAEALGPALAEHELLLVVDNCEVAVDTVAGIVERLLRASPGLTVLATSRERLGLAGERLVPLEGLALPPAGLDDTAAIRASDAVALFVDRAAAASPRRALGDADLAAVVAIARRFEGLPLAIEMAAAGLRSASPAELADRLADPRRALALSGSTTVDRHRTLRAAFESSVDRLDAAEAGLFRRLAAFAAPVTAAAIGAVCSDGADDVGATLASLVERSLVVAVPHGSSTRYGLLVPVREYADMLLEAAGERDAVAARHLAWAVALARAEYTHRIADEAGAIAALTADLEDVRLALARSVGVTAASDQARALRAAGQELASFLGWFWPATGRIPEGRSTGQAALDGATGAIRARLLRGLGYMATYAGEPRLGMELLRDCIAIWRGLDDPLEEALAFSALGWAYLWRGQNELALDAFERGADRADRIRDQRLRPTLQAVLLGGIAQTLVAMRDIPRARDLGARVLREAAAGDLRTLHFGHHFLGDCALFEHDPATAATMYARSLELAITLDDPVETCVELEGLAMAQAGLGRDAEAVALYDAVEAWLARMGVRIQIPFWRELLDEWIGPARARLGSPGEPDGTPLGAAAAVALARSLPTTAPESVGVDQFEK
jgi:predicted ATPase/DNA-binding SARP family transcriptional activator